MINDSLGNYISQLQLLAFFAGYPLTYTLVNFLATERQRKKTFLSKGCVALLPFAYALMATLFIGLLLKNVSPDFSAKNIAEQFPTPYWEVWGALAVLFWIPALSKKPVLSLLHSMPFFLILLKDLMQTSISGKFVIENDMKMYTISLLLHTGALVVMFAISYGLRHFRISGNTTH